MLDEQQRRDDAQHGEQPIGDDRPSHRQPPCDASGRYRMERSLNPRC
jgi:hypothetical protein